MRQGRHINDASYCSTSLLSSKNNEESPPATRTIVVDWCHPLVVQSYCTSILPKTCLAFLLIVICCCFCRFLFAVRNEAFSSVNMIKYWCPPPATADQMMRMFHCNEELTLWSLVRATSTYSLPCMRQL